VELELTPPTDSHDHLNTAKADAELVFALETNHGHDADATLPPRVRMSMQLAREVASSPDYHGYSIHVTGHSLGGMLGMCVAGLCMLCCMLCCVLCCVLCAACTLCALCCAYCAVHAVYAVCTVLMLYVCSAHGCCSVQWSCLQCRSGCAGGHAITNRYSMIYYW
jgi:hypothetical protein